MGGKERNIKKSLEDSSQMAEQDWISTLRSERASVSAQFLGFSSLFFLTNLTNFSLPNDTVLSNHLYSFNYFY